MKKQSSRRLPIPPLRGNLTVAGISEGDDRPEVYIGGDPEGLRSLAAVLCALADVDQKRLADLSPTGAHEHLHLEPGWHLAEKSERLIVGRLDDKSGALPDWYGKRLRKSRPIREYRLMSNV